MLILVVFQILDYQFFNKSDQRPKVTRQESSCLIAYTFLADQHNVTYIIMLYV